MKKKIIVLSMVSLLVLGGCAKGYKEGIYTGTATDSYGGQDNTATAIVTIDNNGKITDIKLDTTYNKDGVVTTKKTLGSDYGMYNNPYGSTIGEWDTQVKALEDFIVENQGLDDIKLNEDGKTDAVSGCTIKIDALYEAAEDALNQAKK